MALVEVPLEVLGRASVEEEEEKPRIVILVVDCAVWAGLAPLAFSLRVAVELVPEAVVTLDVTELTMLRSTVPSN